MPDIKAATKRATNIVITDIPQPPAGYTMALAGFSVNPVGATGVAQVVELVTQLRGRAGERQVDGARVALAQNGGGTIGSDAGAMAVTVVAKR